MSLSGSSESRLKVHIKRHYVPGTPGDLELESAPIVLQAIRKFFYQNERGQDVAEYCLLTALFALIALGIFYRVAGGVNGIWGTANTALATGNANNSGGAATAPGN
jgi:Flp pilus assembly pilin Flp